MTKKTPADGLHGGDKRQGDLHDTGGGTFGPEKDAIARDLERPRQDPLNTSSGRSPPKE